MKKKINLWFILIILIWITTSYAQQSSGAYEYPIKPGSTQWKALNSHDEMVEVSQIPNNIIREISTENLVEACLNYPLYGDMFAYDQLQKGFDVVTAHFNGLQELIKRRDSGKILLYKYIKMDPKALNVNWSIKKQGDYALKFYFIEILIAQNAILSTLQKTERESLLKECIRKAQEKIQNSQFYGTSSFTTIGLIVGRILLIEKFDLLGQRIQTDTKINDFLQDGSIPEATYVNELLIFASQYLAAK